MKEKIYYDRHIFYFILTCIIFALLFDLFRNDDSPIFYRIILSTFLLYIFGYLSRELLEKFENFSKTLKELKEKEETRKKIADVKKLNVAQLQKLLIPALEKEGYAKLDFGKPETDREIIINFTAQDNKADRGEYDSRIQLQRLLKQTLEKTNRRLMSDGAYYRLGILSGQLRGYESEEDLLKLVK